MDSFGNSNWARLKGKNDTSKERVKEIKVGKFGESQISMVVIYLKSECEV